MTDEDIKYLNSILEFWQALHPVTSYFDESVFLDVNALFIEWAYDADLPSLNLSPDDPQMEERQKSNEAEFIKFIDTTKTMHSIHFADIPPDRQGDIGH